MLEVEETLSHCCEDLQRLKFYFFMIAIGKFLYDPANYLTQMCKVPLHASLHDRTLSC